MKIKTVTLGIFLVLIGIYNAVNAQAVKVNSSGYMGLGVASPAYRLDIFGPKFQLRNYNTGYYPLLFEAHHLDPRICSNRKIVFFKPNSASTTDYIDIDCKILYEHSDSTAKENVVEIREGLSKVKKLNGYSYNFKSDKDKEKHSGLIAQQVEKIIPEAVSTTDSTGNKSIAYSTLIPYLIEAIKEQQIEIDDLNKKLEKSENSSKTKNYSKSMDIDGEASILNQNTPNPFTESTEISMYISDDVNTATLYIYDMQGLQKKSIPVSGNGNISITIPGSEFDAGMYIYTLIADGKEIDTKRMILTK